MMLLQGHGDSSGVNCEEIYRNITEQYMKNQRKMNIVYIYIIEQK